MKSYKKGISLIVLVITIIVLAILGAALIISLSNTNVIGEANEAVSQSNIQSYKEQSELAYADWVMDNKGKVLTDITELKEHGFDSEMVPEGYVTYVEEGLVKFAEKIDADIWDGTVATNYAGGTGTEADPYQINTASQLAYLAKTVNDGGSVKNKYFILTSDIDLNNIVWQPIGYDVAANYITFNGNNHTIYNLNVDCDGYGGLFGRLMNSTISNLTLCNGDVNATKAAGALMGMRDCTTITNVNNLGVYVNGDTNNYRIYGESWTCWY